MVYSSGILHAALIHKKNLWQGEKMGGLLYIPQYVWQALEKKIVPMLKSFACGPKQQND